MPTPPEPASRSKRRAQRGVPMAPVLGAAGNATTLLATGAYEVGGVAGLAATGVVATVGAAAAVVRRRKTVQRQNVAKMSRQNANLAHRSGGGSGLSGSSFLSGGGRSGAARSGGGKSGSTGSASGLGGRSGGGSFSPSGRTSGAASGGLAGGKSKGAANGSGASGISAPGSSTPKLSKSKHAKKDAKKTNHGLAAAAGRTARAAAKPGSKPRKALAAVGHGAWVATKATGRGAKKAMTADGTKKAGRATRAGAKKLRGVAADGLRSVVAAAWTGLRKRDKNAALAKLRETWVKRRQKRADKNAAKSKAKADHQDPQNATVATSVRRPTATTVAPASTGGTVMPGGHHFVAPAMEMARIAANYQPTGMLQVGQDFAGLEEALRLTAEAMKATVENADATQPLNPQIIEIMRQIHGLQLKAAELATELPVAFENLHQVDLERLRNPRKGVAGERMWDVTNNLG